MMFMDTTADFSAPRSARGSKKWSPVDRMLAERKQRKSAVEPLPPPLPVTAAHENASTQTYRIACTEGPCVRERDKLLIECSEAKKRARQLRDHSTPATPRKAAVTSTGTSTDSRAEPTMTELVQAQERIALLKNENTKLRELDIRTQERIAELERERATLEKRTQELLAQTDKPDNGAELRQRNTELERQLSREKDLKAEARKKNAEMEKQFKKQLAEKDAMMVRLEKGQDDLVRRVTALQANMVKKNLDPDSPAERIGRSPRPRSRMRTFSLVDQLAPCTP